MGIFVGHAGRHPWPGKVVLVATHADKVNCAKNSRGEYTSTDASLLLDTVREKFYPDFDIANRVFVVDAHLAMSPELKALRVCLGDIKHSIVHVSHTFQTFASVVTVEFVNLFPHSFHVLEIYEICCKFNSWI